MQALKILIQALVGNLLHAQVYPDLIKDVRIRVIELMDHVLSTYDRAISEYTAKEFSRCAFPLTRGVFSLS